MRFQSNTTGGSPPVVFLFSYFTLVAMDVFTTFLATPDLYYEGNQLIRKFSWGWLSILILAVLGVALLSIAFVKSRNIVIQRNNVVKVWKVNLAKLVIYFFLLHYAYSGIVIINNIFSAVYLHQFDVPVLRFLSDIYIELVKSTPNFYTFFQLAIAILTVPILFFYLRRLEVEKSNRQSNETDTALTNHIQ